MVLRHAECRESIYESTTFIFVDQNTIKRFFGSCLEPCGGIRPFLEHTKAFQVSLPINFPKNIPCCSIARAPASHSAYNMHWLRLPDLKNCRNINIWIDARQRTSYLSDLDEYKPINTLNHNELRAAVSTIGASTRGCEVTITTPLAESIGPESGYLTGIHAFHSRVYIWKRHKGDRFYPMSSLGGIIGARILHSRERYVTSFLFGRVHAKTPHSWMRKPQLHKGGTCKTLLSGRP